MQEKVNVWSFILSVSCLLLYLAVAFSGWFSKSVFGVHPLAIVLCLTLFTFWFGLLGFSGVRNWKAMVRSVSTLAITLGLSAFLIYVLLFGSLLD
ncbi:hypothetical protein ABID56_001547 [Alkalibacillus flavidus]|uniref:Uncharacterized protein n=1 Tax=Alkalibacillus flavidus TaxID=546021 RepID=A0ABV2KV45_9BACI